ncbi:putative leucine-rich repeat domain superfamily [Helianthus anomalus]
MTSLLLVFQVAEDVNFAANGITAEAIKAFDGVLQSNITLKTLNLSGNNIGDEGICYLF